MALFRVVASTGVKVRQRPSLSAPQVASLTRGQTIEVNTATRTQADGYFWLQHAQGWSAEKSVNGSDTFLVQESGPVEPPPPPPPTNTLFFRVVTSTGLKVRGRPSASATQTGSLRRDQLIEVDPGSRTEADGYVWWRHALGWSAERQLPPQTDVFMVVVDNQPPPEDPNANTNRKPTILLPNGVQIQRPDLFSRHPIELFQTTSTQYFGNTTFAYELQFSPNLARRTIYYYSQGLHGGIDYYGAVGTLVRASMNGVIRDVVRNTSVYPPNYVRVRQGSFTVVYGHLSNIPTSLQRNQTVTPDTVLGQLETTEAHVHLEVRYQDTWLINPLVFMPPTLTDAFISKFPPSPQYFYRDATWNRWLTPFDQPVLRLSSKANAVIIGPRAPR